MKYRIKARGPKYAIIEAAENHGFKVFGLTGIGDMIDNQYTGVVEPIWSGYRGRLTVDGLLHCWSQGSVITKAPGALLSYEADDEVEEGEHDAFKRRLDELRHEVQEGGVTLLQELETFRRKLDELIKGV